MNACSSILRSRAVLANTAAESARFSLPHPFPLPPLQLQVDMNDLLSFSEELHGLLVDRPGEYLSIFESAAQDVAAQVTAKDATVTKAHEIQIQLVNYPRLTQIRNLQSDHVGKVR